MPYGIFYVQCEITKKNGHLPSVEEAIKLAEQRFDECNQNPCAVFPELADAQEALAKLKCELCPAQFWALGTGYDAYMYQIIENGNIHRMTRRAKQWTFSIPDFLRRA